MYILIDFEFDISPPFVVGACQEVALLVPNHDNELVADPGTRPQLAFGCVDLVCGPTARPT